LIKTKLQNRQRAARPFDRLVGPNNTCESPATTQQNRPACVEVQRTPNLKQTEKPSQTRFADRSGKDENTPPRPQQKPKPDKTPTLNIRNRQSGQKAQPDKSESLPSDVYGQPGTNAHTQPRPENTATKAKSCCQSYR